jgi:hypothetical protein
MGDNAITIADNLLYTPEPNTLSIDLKLVRNANITIRDNHISISDAVIVNPQSDDDATD